MYSTIIELCGLACFVVAAALLGGAPAGFVVAGVCLLFTGASTSDAEMAKNVRAVAALPLRGALAVRNAWRRQMVGQRLLDAISGEE